MSKQSFITYALSALLCTLSVGVLSLSDADADADVMPPIYQVELTNRVVGGGPFNKSPFPPVIGNNFSTTFNHSIATASNVISGRGVLRNQLTLSRDSSPFGDNGRARQRSFFRLFDLNFFDESNPSATGTALVQFGANFVVSATGGALGGTIFDSSYDLRLEVTWLGSPPRQPTNPVASFSTPLVDGNSVSGSVMT